MPKKQVRLLKRTIQAGARPDASPEGAQLARECALLLLIRSIEFGHRRLAVIRFCSAIDIGAEVTLEQREYCRDAANASQDAALQALYCMAVARMPTRSINLEAIALVKGHSLQPG